MSGSQGVAAKERIVRWGGEIGLSAVGIAPAVPPPYSRFLLPWLRHGYHGDLHYLARDPSARADPQKILPGCRSVLSVALDYGGGEDPAEGNPDLGRISRYAWGEDYHTVLKDKLDSLAGKIRAEWPGTDTRAAVDTSPVLEKAFGVAAGVGWMGKHTNLIHPARGSWFFLGGLFTTLSLPPDEPIEDRCGNCTRCMEACPTGAIFEPYVLDARRCLAYWNIERRGPIEERFHASMGNWIFGCDLCQLACPWNRTAAVVSEKRLAPRRENLGRTLQDWAALSEPEFRARFVRSAVRRARYDGLMRNISIARNNAHSRTHCRPRERADPVA